MDDPTPGPAPKKWYPQETIRRAYVRVLEQLFQINAGMLVVSEAELKELLRKEASGEAKLYEDFEQIYRSTHENWREVKQTCPMCGGPPHPLPWEEKGQPHGPDPILPPPPPDGPQPLDPEDQPQQPRLF